MAKIIITDDAELILDMLEMIMTKLGHTVVKLNSGKKLLDTYDEEKPDIVFLDIMMKDNGMDVLVKLKEQHPDAKVVMCSSIAGMNSVIDEAKEKGAVDLIKKPFSTEEIKNIIDKCLIE